MGGNAGHQEVAATLKRLNDAWLQGRVDDLAPFLHPDVVMVVPGFAARVQGREAMIAGFRDFEDNARVHEFKERDTQIDVAGRTAVATVAYEMVYERGGEKYRATGRDVWVFEQQDQGWVAVWRTMLDAAESAV